MKKYRLIKKYMMSPSLGSEVFEFENGYIFEGYTFPKQVIENYPEFWQEVVEKEYEIVKVLSNVDPEKNVLLTYDSNGICINRTDKDDCSHTVNLKEALKTDGVSINCVKRLSDNQLFYVGEETNFGRIKGFDIEFDDLIVIFHETCELLGDIEHANEEFEVINWKITNAKPLDMIGVIVSDMWVIGFQCISKIINSVKRDIDQQIFTVGDMVKDHEDSIRLKIKSFTVRRKQGVGRHFFGKNLIWVDYEGDYMGNWLNNIIKTEKKPIFTTEDGVDIFDGDKYYCVHFTDSREVQPSFNKIPLFKVYGPNKAFSETEEIHYTKDAKYFSTEEAAQKYVKLNEPKYSLQDILNARLDYIIPEVGAIAIDFEELENKK